MGFYFLGTFIPYYGLCIVIGIICAFLLSYFLCKKRKIDTDDLILICTYLLLFGFLGAKILYILVSYKSLDFRRIFSSLKEFNAFLNSGFVFFGGILGGIVGFLFVKKVHHININEYVSCITPGICIAHSFGRIGCSLAGCCYGRVTHGNFYFRYTESIAAPNNVKLFPVQGIEAFFVFIIGIGLFIMVLKKSKLKVEYIYILLYSFLRFFLEFFRGDNERGFLFFLSTSQIISFFAIIIILIFIFCGKKTKKIIYY